MRHALRYDSGADSLPGRRSWFAAIAGPVSRGAGGVQFVSLQKGQGKDDTSAALDLLPLGAGLIDFADMAALIVNLDLLISVDTAAAHLGGALGKPWWVLLPDYGCNWRWLAGRIDTPWYPGAMRLFRQHDATEWGLLIGAVAASLQRKNGNHMSGDSKC